MRKETLILGGIGLVTLLLLVGAAFMLGGEKAEETQVATADKTKLIGERRNAVGSESAKVTIVEFADFQCPACGTAHPIVKQILEEYGDRIQYIYRHFPLPGHKNARIAARAAEAAGAQGKFFEMHNMLFETQQEWSEPNNPQEIFVGYAQSLGLDTAAFAEDMGDDVLSQAIQNDVNAGIELGVNSTPTFYINGKQYPGVLSYDNFKQIIDKELQQ